MQAGWVRALLACVFAAVCLGCEREITYTVAQQAAGVAALTGEWESADGTFTVRVCERADASPCKLSCPIQSAAAQDIVCRTGGGSDSSGCTFVCDEPDAVGTGVEITLNGGRFHNETVVGTGSYGRVAARRLDSPREQQRFIEESSFLFFENRPRFSGTIEGGSQKMIVPSGVFETVFVGDAGSDSDASGAPPPSTASLVLQRARIARCGSR